MKTGFNAYEEIQNLARRLFDMPNHTLSVQAAIMGDSYKVIVDQRTIIDGTAEEVRYRLNQGLTLMGK